MWCRQDQRRKQGDATAEEQEERPAGHDGGQDCLIAGAARRPAGQAGGRPRAPGGRGRAGSGRTGPGRAGPGRRRADRPDPEQAPPPALTGPRIGQAAPAAPAPAPAESPDGLPAWAAKAAEKLLTVTCWLDPGEQGDPFTATVYFSGRRAEVTGKPRPGDTFSQEETVAGIVPGSGPVAVTAEVRGVSSGEWTVTARPVARPGGSPVRPYPPPGANGASALRVPWPRRVPIPASPAVTVRTAMLPFTKVPGVIRFAYATMVSLGVLFGLGLETLLLTGHH